MNPGTWLTLEDVREERRMQDIRWGEQNHPDGTSPQWVLWADKLRDIADAHVKAGTLTWRNILDEEIAEAYTETDPARLRAELVQVAAVACAWVEAIDRRAVR